MLPGTVWANLAPLERVDKHALRPPRKQAFKTGLTQMKRQLAQIISALDQNVESAKALWQASGMLP